MVRILVRRSSSWIAVLAAALLVTGVACKKKAPAEGGDKAVAAPLGSDVGSVAFPENVMMFGGIKSLDDFTAAATSAVALFNPQLGPMIAAQVPALLQGQVLGVKNLTWLDTKKAIKVVVLDYKQFPAPFAVLMAHKGKDALTAALPDNKAAGTDGNETKFSSPMGQDLFLNVVGDWAVFTMDPKVFGAVKTFVAGDFAKYEFTELLDLQVSSTNLQRVAGAEIEKFKATITDYAAGPSALPIPGVEKLLKDEVALFMDVLAQTEVARLVLKFDGSNVVLKGALKVVDGKSLAKMVAGTKDRKLELYKTLPAGGWLVAAANLDPSLAESWMNLGLEFWAGILKLDDAEKAKLTALMKSTMLAQTGDSAFWVGRDGEFPVRLLSISGVKDGEAAKKASYETYTMLFSKLGVLVDTYAGPAAKTLPKLDWTSLKAFTEGLRPVLAQSGVTVNLKNDTVAGVSVDAVELAVDFTKLPGGTDPKVAEVARVVGNKLSGAIGWDKTRMFGAFGKDATADIGKLAQGQAGTGGALADALAKFAADTRPAMGVYLSFTDLMKVIAIFDAELAASLPGLTTAEGDIGFTFVLGGHGDRALDGVFAMPLAKIAALMPKGPAQGGAPLSPAP